MTPTLDALLTECDAKGYRLNLYSSARGWEVLLWDGPTGYSPYTVANDPSPTLALRRAIDSLDRGEGRILDCNQPAAGPPDLSALFADLIPQSSPLPKLRLKSTSEAPL